jgi:Cysteine-rich CWC
MRGPVQKTCEACGLRFECGQYGCWCRNIHITEQQMDWIAARFQDCLCPACLNKVTIGALEALPHKSIHPTRAE